MSRFLTTHHPVSAAAHYAAGTWQGDTLYALLARQAAARPHAHALRDGRRRLTWAETKAWVDGTGAAFAAMQLKLGERVSIWLPSRLEAIVTFLACSRQGLACNPSLHRTYRTGEIETLLQRLGARVLVTEEGWGADRVPAEALSGLSGRVPCLRAVLTPDTFPAPGAEAGPPVIDPDSVSYLAFTSGTTGTPKCVMHSDNTLLANARDLVRDWGHDAGTRLLSLAPFSHHIAWVALCQSLLTGCELITNDPPPGRAMLDWILETGATYVMGVPTHAMDVLNQQAERGLARLGEVSVFYMAGSPIPPVVAEAFVRQGIRPQNVYGMTENSSHQYTHPTDDTATIVSTCGRGGAAYEVRIFDVEDQDREVPPGTVGQIGGRGAALMLGYFDNQAATEASYNRGGWFMSGDLGSLDAGGNLRVEGRLKDLIIRGGHNIYPATIEALALRHAAVERAAAFPVPDERLGEKVCLAIIGAAEPHDLLQHLHREGLSRFDMPEYFLRLEAFPLTASGKVLKRDLVALAAEGRISPEPIRIQLPREA